MIEQRSNGTLYYLDRIWVPIKGEVRTLIMDEAHKLKYYIHLGADKMYYDLRDRYSWPGMKKDIADYLFFFLLLLAAAFIQEFLLGLCLFCEIKELQNIPAIDHLLCDYGSQSQPLILLEFRGLIFSLGAGISGDEWELLPTRFDGKKWRKSKEKGVQEMGGKLIQYMYSGSNVTGMG
uniref:Putative reverse transcriptase domain-containing protein n=1 Tax=Tanacetum cinerariifolium TaxID=118510 RepID=A0A699JDP2_TANCI|nr:putative reverse transcriptase domain-containing protein [Tanacetum cinerariifolium]